MTLTDFISRDLQEHIEAGRDVPCKLTIAAMSAHYRVSLTPVRAAVDQLIKDQYLVKQSNGRLRVCQPPRRANGAKSIDKAPRKPIDLEEVIRRDVVREGLTGAERYLREEGTAEKYGVGRTALRPILSRLSGQGFLEYVPRCGWKIRKLDESDLKAYLQCREALELKALDLARPRLETSDLEQMLAGNRAKDAKAHAVFDNSLHSYWIKRSENQYIINFFATHGRFYSTLLEYLAPEAEVVAQVAQQHCEILEATIDQRWTDARRSLRRHIRDQLPIARKAMASLDQ